MLALVSIDAGRLTAMPHPVRVADHIDAALATTAATGVAVTCARDLRAAVQPGHLDQILTNLISNAAKYGGGATAIIVHGPPAPAGNGPPAPAGNGPPAPARNGPPAPARNGPPAPARNGPPAPARNGPPRPAGNGPPAPGGNGPAGHTPPTPVVTVEVHDEGPGVPPEFRERLFDRFARAESTAGTVTGTGLGLYIVRELARANDGDVHYRPAPTKGSIFTLTLRAVEEDTSPTSPW